MSWKGFSPYVLLYPGVQFNSRGCQAKVTIKARRRSRQKRHIFFQCMRPRGLVPLPQDHSVQPDAEQISSILSIYYIPISYNNQSIPIGMVKAAKRAGHPFGSIPARSFFNGSTSFVVLQSAANPRGFPQVCQTYLDRNKGLKASVCRFLLVFLQWFNMYCGLTPPRRSKTVPCWTSRSTGSAKRS